MATGSLQNTTISIDSRFGVKTHNGLLRHEPASDRLLIMLPGRGYTCENPLLYMLRQAALAQNYDVLSVQYGFQIANSEFAVERMADLQNDVKRTVEPVRAMGYKHICVAGKSLGTPLAVGLARALKGVEVSLILLTPVGGVAQGAGAIRTLAIIGSNDAFYSPGEVEGFRKHPNVSWRVFDKLDHSLEYPDDWRASLEILPEIIYQCETFLKENGPEEI